MIHKITEEMWKQIKGQQLSGFKEKAEINKGWLMMFEEMVRLDARRDYLKEFEKVINNFNEFGNIILYMDLINWIKEQEKELRCEKK